MTESGWCPYCQEVVNQQTELKHGKLEDRYETTCCKCHRLIRWHLVAVKKKSKEYRWGEEP